MTTKTYPGFGWVSDYVENIVGANTYVISEDLNNKISTVLIRRNDQGAFDWGYTMPAVYANRVIDFFSDNGVVLNDELINFINQWQAINEVCINPRFGIDASRSLNGDNTIWIGGVIPYAANWWINDYDLGDLNVEEAVKGGVKLGYNLTEERFVTLKLYSRFRLAWGDDSAATNYVYSIDADNNCTLITTQGCKHYPSTTDVVSVTQRWEDILPSINTLQAKYEAYDWCRGTAIKFNERVQTGEGAQNQGYFYLSVMKNRDA